MGGNDPEAPEAHAMAHPTDDVRNWMNMFRWIVKLIRDEYDVDESILTRSAVLESDCGLAIEQVELLLETIGTSFELRFPAGTLDEVVKLEELCMLAAWMKGLYKRPEFISAGFEEHCRSANAACG
ncbi:MAG: acyl carrier protein [Rhodopila sp.]